MTARVCIETSRLILRTVTMADIEDVASSWKLDEGPISREEAEEKVRWMLDNHEQNVPGKIVHLCLAIVDQGTGELIGWCGLDHRDQAKENPVLFYLLKAAYWGKGLATEAAMAVLDYAFRVLDLARIDSAAAFENIASKRVMEKIGMRYVGLDEEGGYFFTRTKGEYLREVDMPMLPEIEIFWRFIVSSVNRILACLEGLPEEDLNWRPLENANSLYVLATHTMGNVEENLLAVLGGQAVHRQREAEFAVRGSSLELLSHRWSELQDRVASVLEQLAVTELDRVREHPRRGPLTGREVLIVVARHAAEHMGQAELTRDLLFSARGRMLPPREY